MLEWVLHAPPWAVFLAAALGVLPLAALMGRATEQLAARFGEGVGGLLNATFGNAAELILALAALRAGLVDLVKASLTGSILGNVLLVFGLSALAGGLRHDRQRFDPTAAGLGATLLLLSAVGLVVPAAFHELARGRVRGAVEQNLSLEIAVVLFLAYIGSLVFSLGTHRHLYVGKIETEGEPPAPLGRALGLLLLATAGVAVLAELLVGATAATARAWGWSELFLGVIVVAVVGNAAEHGTAVLFAVKNRMDTAVQIAVGSSVQIALFVAPLLVFLSYLVAPRPLDLLFTPLEVVAVVLTAAVMAQITQDGASHWMEGVLLLAVYAILGLAFYFFPVVPAAAPPS